MKDSPLLEGRDLHLHSDPKRSEHVSITGSSAYLHGTKRIIDYLVQPELHLQCGQWWLLGQPAAGVLRSGQAAIAPSRLPWASSARLGETLAISAGLLGLSSKVVRPALAATGLSRQQRARLGELSDIEQRRAGLAHALLSDPQLLIMVQPLAGLNDAKRRELGRLIEQLIATRMWILGGESGCSVSQQLGHRAQVTLSFAHDAFALDSRSRAASARAKGAYFLHFGQAPHALSSELRQRGASVTLSENPRVLLVDGLTPGQIDEACAAVSGVQLLRLEPADEGGFRSVHARSAL